MNSGNGDDWLHQRRYKVCLQVENQTRHVSLGRRSEKEWFVVDLRTVYDLITFAKENLLPFTAFYQNFHPPSRTRAYLTERFSSCAGNDKLLPSRSLSFVPSRTVDERKRSELGTFSKNELATIKLSLFHPFLPNGPLLRFGHEGLNPLVGTCIHHRRCEHLTTASRMAHPQTQAEPQERPRVCEPG